MGEEKAGERGREDGSEVNTERRRAFEGSSTKEERSGKIGKGQ